MASAETKGTGKLDFSPKKLSEKPIVALTKQEGTTMSSAKSLNDSKTTSKSSKPPSRPVLKFGAKITIQPLATKRSNPEPAVLPKKAALASVFNDESSEEEEMPLEARMRMRNIGRDTKTACGPNSFNKGALGFTDPRSWEHQHKEDSKE